MTRRRTLLLGWLATVLVVAAFCALGAWQLDRMQQKQAMLASVQNVLHARHAVPLAHARLAAHSQAIDWFDAPITLADAPPLLLDNQIREGRPGVHVFRVASADDGTRLLADMGWLAVGADRTLPSAAVLAEPPAGTRIAARGLLLPPPAAGLALGDAMQPSGSGWLMPRVDIAAIDRALGTPASQPPLAPRILRLDPALPVGFARDLDVLPNTLPPERHLGYAVQWFGLALAVLVTALVMTFRRPRKRRPMP